MLGRAALLAVSIVVGLLMLELGLRLIEVGPGALVDWPNYVRQQRIASRAHSGAQARPIWAPGFVGQPGYASADLNYGICAAFA